MAARATGSAGEGGGLKPVCRSFWILLCFFAWLAGAPPRSGRIVLTLDGNWDVEESLSTEAPTSFGHRGPVPGLANLAIPVFDGVDQFDTRESISGRIRSKLLPETARIQVRGVSRQARNYFWYRTTFRPTVRKQVAILKIAKAQFGTAVWLNGKPAGEHAGCFTAGFFDLAALMNWDGNNELIIRIGAHPGMLPAGVPAGTDGEKLKWTPGIYDGVSLLLGDNPFIETVQVAPRIASSEILIQTRVKNRGSATVSFSLRQSVRTWKGLEAVAASRLQGLKLRPGEEHTLVQVVRVPSAKLWSPESPFLYLLETSTGGDSASTRFGMREFRFDTPTRRAYLNGNVYFMRGSNITLHRFFEDPLCRNHPWDERWVRKLLAEIPKRMSWNSFRFCIGPVPDKWLDIADEVGLLIQNEFFIWGYAREWNTSEMKTEIAEWMRDNWNHPSVVIWDSCNETSSDVLVRDVVPAVRKLDLSNRPWENSYNPPQDPDDPVEDHPYEFHVLGRGGNFQMTDLEKLSGSKMPGAQNPSAHALILNEYGYLWLNRDGTPTELTRKIYEKLVGPAASPAERLELNAYLLAGLTEYFRAHRNFAAVLHFVYVTGSYPGAYTADHFRDVENLELEPHFEDYVGQAFKPLGVYINFWQPSIEANSDRRIAVMLVNDHQRTLKGTLRLALEMSASREVARAEQDFLVPAGGQQTYSFTLRTPEFAGDFILKAIASTSDLAPTISRRKVKCVKAN